MNQLAEGSKLKLSSLIQKAEGHTTAHTHSRAERRAPP